jgi:hypothetical protein
MIKLGYPGLQLANNGGNCCPNILVHGCILHEQVIAMVCAGHEMDRCLRSRNQGAARTELAGHRGSSPRIKFPCHGQARPCLAMFDSVGKHSPISPNKSCCVHVKPSVRFLIQLFGRLAFCRSVGSTSVSWEEQTALSLVVLGRNQPRHDRRLSLRRSSARVSSATSKCQRVGKRSTV